MGGWMADDWMGGAASSHCLPALSVDIPPPLLSTSLAHPFHCRSVGLALSLFLFLRLTPCLLHFRFKPWQGINTG